VANIRQLQAISYRARHACCCIRVPFAQNSCVVKTAGWCRWHLPRPVLPTLVKRAQLTPNRYIYRVEGLSGRARLRCALRQQAACKNLPLASSDANKRS